MNKITLCLLSLVFGLAANTATAATYYVDDANGLDSNPGTSPQPWKTIGKAQSTVTSGDTVIVRNGSYGAWSAENVTNTSWITYQAAAGHTPVLSEISINNSIARNSYLVFDGFKIESGQQKGVWARKVRYLQLKNLDVSGSVDIAAMDITLHQYPGIMLENNGAVADANIENCTVHSDSNSKRMGYTSGIEASNSDNVSISGCNVSECGYGIYVYGDDISVKDCNVHDIINDGIMIYQCNNLLIESNIIHGLYVYRPTVVETPTSTTWSADGKTMTNPNAKWKTAGDTLITTKMKVKPNSGNNTKVGYYNYDVASITSDTEIVLSSSIKLDPNGPAPSNVDYNILSVAHTDLMQIVSQVDHSGITIRGNQLYDQERTGDGNLWWINLEGVGGRNYLIENNLLWNIYTDEFDERRSYAKVGKVHGFVFRNNTIIGRADFGNDSDAEVYNNIMSFVYFGSTAGLIKNDFNIINRLYYDSGYPPPDGGHNEVFHYYSLAGWNDPAFTSIFANYANGDFRHASATSLGVGHGDPANYPLSDILGNSRDFSPDAGCYEYIPLDPNNHAPIPQDIGNKSVNENTLLTFTINATDPDGDTITYSAQSLPTGATFSNQTFSWTLGYDQANTYNVTFVASDEHGAQSSPQTVTITVNNVNRPPVLAAIGNKSVSENSALSFSVSATDPDSDSITYLAEGLPSGAAFVGQSFNWTPGYDQTGTYQVTFIAGDSQTQDTETIAITVSNVNRPPVLSSIGNKSVYVNDTLSFSVSAADPDSDTIAFSTDTLPAGATFAGQSFNWQPDSTQVGSHQVTFTASDGTLQDSETITITVLNTDTSPPVVANCSPGADSIQIPLNTLVVLHIADAGDGVDAGSVAIKVNDDVIYSGDTLNYSSARGNCRRLGTKADYTYVYQSNEMFDFDRDVTVTVNAADLAGNVMSQRSYSFTTEMRSFGQNKKVGSGSDTLSKAAPATVWDIAGNIWAAWHAGPAGSRDIYVGKLAAGADNFGSSIQLTQSTADQCNPAIAIGSDNKLYVVWQDNRSRTWDIYVSISSDGVSWSAEKRVTDTNDNQVNPAIAVDTSNRAYIVWQDDRNVNQDIYIAASSNGFATETVSQITSNITDQIEPAVAVDSSNTVYVVWTDARNGSSDIYGAASNKGPWTNVPIVNSTGNQSSPAIATESEGSILHLLWVDDRSGNQDIYYATSNGLPSSSLSGSSIIDDTSAANQSAPAIITNSSSKVFACWQDQRNVATNGGDTDLYFAELTSGSRTNVLVGDDSTNSSQSEPAMGIGEYGHPYLVWTDGRNANTEIYYAGSTFVEPVALTAKDVSAPSGAVVGTEPASISSVDDVSIVVPAGTYSCDIRVTISKIKNPQAFAMQCLGSYDFGPSGMQFSQPVTITIPYSAAGSAALASAYWYNSLTGALSQQGITNIENLQISSTLYALRFKTTHFTLFSAYRLSGGGDAGAGGATGGGGGGGGGCSISAGGEANFLEFTVPYIGLSIVMVILKLRDRRNQKTRSNTESKC
jgi:parallel beta-helix repeat protein